MNAEGDQRSPRIVDEDVPGLGDAFGFFRRHWLALSVGALGGLVTALVGTWLLTETVYQASATLFIHTDPPIATDVSPIDLSGYQKILESSAVVSATEQRLEELDVLKAGQALRVGDNLHSNLVGFDQRNRPTVAPVLEAQAKGPTPEIAALVANTWARAFVDYSESLASLDLSDVLEFLGDQLSELHARIDTLSGEKAETAEVHQRGTADAEERWLDRIAGARAQWDERVTSLRKETEDLVATYKNATRRIMEGVLEDYGLASDQNDGLPRDPSAGDRGSALLTELTVLRIQLANTPERLSLEGNVPEAILWEPAYSGPERLPGRLAPRQHVMTVQEHNPLHGELVLRITALERELAALTSEVGDVRLRELARLLAELQQERLAGLARLMEDRALVLNRALDQRQAELDKLLRRQLQELNLLELTSGLSLAEVERSLQDAVGRARQLEKRYNDTELAREAQRLPDVTLAAEASPPREPLPRPLTAKLILGLLAGTIVGLGVALIREGGAA